jgi:hypothetical protein
MVSHTDGLLLIDPRTFFCVDAPPALWRGTALQAVPDLA